MLVKELAYGAAHAVGLPGLGRRARRDGLTILTYHSFGSAAEHPYLLSLPVAAFTEQLRHLTRHYDVVTIEQGLDRLRRRQRLAPAQRPMVAITVDDGYADNYTSLFPLIKAAGVPATLFLATDYLDTGRLPWPTRVSALLHYATADRIAQPIATSIAQPAERAAAGRMLRRHLSRLGSRERETVIDALTESLAPRPFVSLPPLTWAQVREMMAAGVQMGAHTHYHGWLDCLSAEERAAELTLSRQRIEAETGNACRLLAYPNGNWNADVAAAARAAGFTAALTQDNGVNRRDVLDPFALHRIEVPYNERIGTFACRVGGIAL